MTKTKKTRPAKGTPTDLNLYVLKEVFGDANVVPNGTLRATQVPHMRRCLKAGLLEVVSKTELRLTAAGAAALGRAL